MTQMLLPRTWSCPIRNRATAVGGERGHQLAPSCDFLCFTPPSHSLSPRLSYTGISSVSESGLGVFCDLLLDECLRQ